MRIENEDMEVKSWVIRLSWAAFLSVFDYRYRCILLNYIVWSVFIDKSTGFMYQCENEKNLVCWIGFDKYLGGIRS